MTNPDIILNLQKFFIASIQEVVKFINYSLTLFKIKMLMLAKLTAKRYWLTFSVLLFSFAVFGQKSLTGKITGPDNQPVFGATVSIKGTNVATTTATDGSFSLTVPGNKSTIVVTYVGYETTEVNVAGKSSIDVGLKLQTSNLNEVIVTGYTAQKKKEITGAVSVVSVKDLK